ncbi:MAG TPA: NADP-dependent isocitrate dehydrogenase, partial [Aquaticitalea sp.]|nr:NADP-dependent isocitrate dehydrogenase [Aquaticitalea sp.]
QFLHENHLRWDSLGEFLALAVSLEHLAKHTGNQNAQILADCLDEATEKLLETGKSPSRKVKELDNRGSHFYLAMYWAKALANQSNSKELQNEFRPIAESLVSNENTIVSELNDIQGHAVNIGGYYKPDGTLVSQAMRPSATFNKIMEKQ